MIELLQFMAAPLVACTLLAGIHGYLGIHVVRRGVIFVDIALAQMAALGAAVGLLFHIEIESLSANVLSVLFTFGGAMLLAGIRRFERKVPIEAYIGVLYVVGAALVILIMDRAPHGAEHIKQLLVGQILWVNWSDVLVESIVYGIIGLIFFFIHSKIYAISQEDESGAHHEKRIFIYDMVFYALFGIVVTVSVRVAGVLLVFTYLVVPAIISVLFAERFLYRLLLGGGIGVVISFAGVIASYRLDFPTGAAVVASAGFILVVMSVWKGLLIGKKPRDMEERHRRGYEIQPVNSGEFSVWEEEQDRGEE